MVLAPHPDDESLATGGLLQRAVAAGASVAVLLASDGEDNPWPQRVLEGRWQIGARERERWGSRRRREALAALRVLGVGEDAVRYLGFPDQGCTRFLLGAHEAPLGTLTAAIRDWRPTLLVVPSPDDT